MCNFIFREEVLIPSQLYQHKIEGYTLMCLVLLKPFKCCVVSVVFMTLSALLQRKLKDEKCLVFIQLVFCLVNPEVVLNTGGQFRYISLGMCM